MSSSNLRWVAENGQNSFAPLDDSKSVWAEKINDQAIFNFKFVNFDSQNGLHLRDDKRNVSILISESEAKAGDSLNNLSLIYNGRWVDLDELKAFANNNAKSNKTASQHSNGTNNCFPIFFRLIFLTLKKFI
jgi:hypothetical protein